MGMSSGESAVLRACLALLEVRGIMAWRNNTGALKVDGRLVRFGHAGSSDILGILPWGRFLAVEVKAPSIPALGKSPGRLSRAQSVFLLEVNRSRGVGIWVCDVMVLNDVLNYLLEDPWCEFRLDGSLII